jgi:hypothetical protein
MKQKDILFILISSFVLTVAWVCFNLYHKWVTTTISSDLQMQLNPIDPNFDMDTFEKLKQREQVTPSYNLDGSIKSASQPGQIQPNNQQQIKF